MQTRSRYASFVTLAAALGLSLTASAQVSSPNLDIKRNNLIQSTFGVYLLGETEPSTDPAYFAANPNRNAGPFAVSPNRNFAIGGDEFFVGAASNGFFDSAVAGGSPGRQDILGFRVLVNPEDNSAISVTRRVVATADANVAQTIAALAPGAVNNNGRIAFRYDRFNNGGSNNSAIGTVEATAAVTSIFDNTPADYYTPSPIGTFIKHIQRADTTNLTPPAIGGTTNLLFTTSFAREIIAAAPTFTAPFNYNPFGKTLATIAAPNDNRGSIAYNSVAGIAVVYNNNVLANGVRIYKVNSSLTTASLQDVNGNASTFGTFVPFPTNVKVVGGTSFNLVGTNYFGRTGFAGPMQISINDNGDIAVLTSAVPSTSTNSDDARRAIDKRVLFLPRTGPNTYGIWETVAQSGTNVRTVNGVDVTVTPGTGDFVTQNPVLGSPNNIAVGAPTLDNDGNVFFTAAHEVYLNTGAQPFSTVRTSIFRASRVAANNFAKTVVLREGDELENPETLSVRRVTFLPLAVATSDVNNPNISDPADNVLGPNTALKDSRGGLVAAFRASDEDADPNVPTRWYFAYLAFR